MERAEAEAIYEQGRETVVAVLLELSSQNALLRRQVAELSERLDRRQMTTASRMARLGAAPALRGMGLPRFGRHVLYAA